MPKWKKDKIKINPPPPQPYLIGLQNRIKMIRRIQSKNLELSQRKYCQKQHKTRSVWDVEPHKSLCSTTEGDAAKSYQLRVRRGKKKSHLASKQQCIKKTSRHSTAHMLRGDAGKIQFGNRCLEIKESLVDLELNLDNLKQMLFLENVLKT